MSEYDSFDSFESGSDSESDSEALQVLRVRELSEPKRHVGRVYSDHDELESSTASTTAPQSLWPNTLKVEKSPKPSRRLKVKVKKPNIGNFTQKIKNKLRKDIAVFGVSLETAIQRSQLGTDNIELPTVFRECIDDLENRGIEHEGIFRLPGVKSKVEEAKQHYDKGDIVDLVDCDPNAVASLLKLYLRELPEPLIPFKLVGKFEAVATLPVDEQLPMLQELMEEIGGPHKLMLTWLLVHMNHIVEQSAVNKMTLPNLVIVFSPTLQIPPPSLHTILNHVHALFGDVELKKYQRPSERKASGVIIIHTENLETEQEITAELAKLEANLKKLHGKVAGKYDERDEHIWELQRAITELRRKRKAIQKTAQKSRGPDDEEFIKTLMLMEATLTAENEELVAKKEKLQAAIKREADLIEQHKEQLKNFPIPSDGPSSSDEESGDEEELAKKVAALRWHGKELELRNKNLIKSIQEEEEAILELRVKLKVLPVKQKLNLEE